MRYVGRALAAAGSSHDGVRRLYAQSLIETRDFSTAKSVLDALISGDDTSSRERFEACGLLGRLFKQRYVDAPSDPSAPNWLAQAIEAYEAVYRQDHQQFWHGVNAASCMLRAARDHVHAGSRFRAREIAEQVLMELDTLAVVGRLEVWDCASLVEALVALEHFESASAALGDYLHHTALTAFEVSSTLRQFDRVLELGRRQPGGDLLERLQHSALRYRAGGLTAGTQSGASALQAMPMHEMAVAPDGPTMSPLVMRVSHPG